MSANKPLIVTITGPSATGKTVLSNLMEGKGFQALTSTTTRNPREGEVDGKDYYFISKDEFQKLVNEGKFIEKIEYNETLYGVSVKEAEKAFSNGKNAVLVAEPNGVKQIEEFCKEKDWDICKVFINNNYNILIGRLLNRLLIDIGYTLKSPPDELNPNHKEHVNKIVMLIDNKNAKEEHFAAIINDFLKNKRSMALIKKDPEKIISDGEIKKRINAAIKRFKSLSFEKENWVKPVLSSENHIYDLVINSFGKKNELAALNQIMKKLDEFNNQEINSIINEFLIKKKPLKP